MAVKLLYYFIFTFLGIFLFLMIQEPYLIEGPKKNGKEANIELFSAISYSIDEKSVSSIIEAKKAYRYDGYDKFERITMQRMSKPKFVETLKSNEGKLVKSQLTLSGNVKYNNSDNVRFYSQEVRYDLDKKVAKSDKEFILKDDTTVVHGDSLVYKSEEGHIFAKNIKSTSKVNEK